MLRKGISGATAPDSDIWRKTAITEKYVRQNRELLEHPETMSEEQLAEAVTFCQTVDNPFAEEFCRRAGLIDEWSSVTGWRRRKKTFEKAAGLLGFRFY